MPDITITMRHVVTVHQGETMVVLGQEDVRRLIAAGITAVAMGKTDDLHRVITEIELSGFLAPSHEREEAFHSAKRIPIVGETVSFYEGNQPVQIRQGTVVSFEKPLHSILLITVEMPNGKTRTITAESVVGRIYG